MHGVFAATASPEINTPLAALGGFIETLQESAKDDPAARERFLAIMAQQADRMRRLVDDLLSLNRIELGEHVPPRDDLDLRRLTLEAVAQMSAFEEGRIEMDLHGVDAPLTVRGDAAQLEQAVVNLVENALKYGGDARPIRVTAAERTDPRRQIGLRVEDSGPGIPKEHLPRLTERFYRVERASERQASGTGLGLSIVKHVVSRHRGALEVESRPGRGSRFTLWLPPAEEFDIASSPDI
ncbi:MAG: ATP-binding protein [Pseudomonadota bacterium]